jgi:hypothetical protein
MNNSSAGGFLAILMILATIGSWIGSGVIAWNWVEPDSFFSAVGFLIVWGILGKVFNVVFGLIAAGIASMLD